jgi:gluconolactonase
MPTFDEHQIRSFAGRIDHCEGVAYGPDGFLYCGGYAGQVYRVNLETGDYDQYHQLAGGRLLGVALDADNNLYGCDAYRSWIVKIAPDGRESVYARGTADQPMRCPNWLVFDRAGNLYVSDSGDWEHRIGRVWKVVPGGEAEVWFDGSLFTPNGMALDAAEQKLYVIDTFDLCVHAIDIGEDGRPGAVEKVIEMPRTMLDGLAFDAQSQLWLVCHRPDALYRLDLATRRAELFVEDWRGEYLRGPANLVFAGPNRDVMITSSLDNGCLYRIDAGIPGQALNYPHLS